MMADDGASGAMKLRRALENRRRRTSLIYYVGMLLMPWVRALALIYALDIKLVSRAENNAP